MRKKVWLMLGVVWAVSAALAADPAAALQDFQLGQKFQAARQWGDAAKQYSKSLQDDPKAYWAYKALGTVYYQAGDHRGALSYYHRYLAVNPSDTATKAFADRLQSELGGPAPAAAAPAPASQEGQDSDQGTFHGGFGVIVEGAGVMSNGADVAKGLSVPGAPATASAIIAPAFGTAADYTTDGGFLLGLELLDGPDRVYHVTFYGAPIAETLTITNEMAGLEAGWSLGFARHVLVKPTLELGYMASTLTMGSASDTASGFEAWPKLGAEFVWGHWGVGLSLGYLWAQLSPVKNSQGQTIKQFNTDGSTSTWVLDNGGVSFGFYAAYHFTAPF